MGGKKQLTTEKFIERSNIKHNFKYDYSKSFYIMFLNKKHIIFEKQKKFNWLGRQSLDFYLPKYNIGIECQGEQHYKPVDFGGKGLKWATEQFKYTVKKDNIKKQKCENNGVKLLYYSNFNKKIVL